MNGASKILTVSYGTFSCTLEGFDDPFNTMKAIAEYFRDLAADDRYFGAEPATPDAAMLHRIAEREIQRRVESKIQENGVILRAQDAPAPRVTMPAVQPYHIPVAAVAPSLAAVAEPAVESAAARLSRLRAAQTQVLKPAAAVEPLVDLASRFADAQNYAEDQDAEPAPKAPIAVAAPPLTQVIETPVAAEAATDVVVVQEIGAVEIVAAEAAVEAATEPLPEAAPAQADPVADAQPQAVEDILASVRETLAGMIGQDDQLAEDMAADGSAAFTAELDEDCPAIDLSFIADQIGSDDPGADEPDHALCPTADIDLTFPEPVEGGSNDQADLAALEAAPDATLAFVQDAPTPIKEELVALAEIAVEPQAEAAALPTAPETVAEPQQAEVSMSPDAPVVAEKLQRARARVIKIRRLDKTVPAVPAAPPPVSEAVAALPEPPAAAPKSELPALTAEAEADLENQLAALALEIGPLAEAAPVDDRSVEESLDAALAADLLPLAVTEPDRPDSKAIVPVADDAAVDRILAQTNSALEVPETKRRRSAIAHLKAAVMATVAERRINPNASKTDATVRMDPYRQDLNQVVRPAPTPDRPAPLVLVSAQRIDRPRDLVADAQRPVPQIVPSLTPVAPPRPVQPVRPRRVTPSGSATASVSSLAHAVAPLRILEAAHDVTADDLDQVFAKGDKQSFTEFAESLGAASLPELMEAAGAYCTLILDTPSFTRPQLFRQMQQMPELAEMSREDSLRGFGKLLRDGRIQKSVRGQFVLSEKSPLLHEAKRIAG